ncbi:MAG: 3-phosphoshikimate 1-carboxyvinyltransferase [Candidatus Anoxychlamydiales bacterium]|nr:3-phosphoshikimate 1-carboxyvinyltransferase [Candidatus Anoxychlamydiales bacterium]HEU64817.1 3-phosphoshikimate 1-carboxyvinyltransferase [Chlamydiota bacterium]
MKNFFVKKSIMSGEIIVPSSKSQTMRAILFASLSKGRSKIKNFLKTDDILAFIEGCRKFKAKIEIKKNSLEIFGTNRKILLKDKDKLDVKNSGIALRFLTSIYALSDKKIIITGDESIKTNRSMKPLIEALSCLGAHIKSIHNTDFAPLQIKGPIISKNIQINGEDSQFVSSMLIAASLLDTKMQIEVINPKEKPWVKLTLSWLNKMNIKVENQDFQKFILYPPSKFDRKAFRGFDYMVPTDFSTILFPIAAALITKSNILIKDVVFDDFQNDQKTIEIFKKLKANIYIDKEKNQIRVEKSILEGNLEIDVDDIIDSIPILAVIGCYNRGKLMLKNGLNARKKESDRIFAITNELKKMKAKIIEKKDGLGVEGSKLEAATLNSHRDHRIAMALTIAALGIEKPSLIEDVDCINKTYPTFKKDFKSLGCAIL